MLRCGAEISTYQLFVGYVMSYKNDKLSSFKFVFKISLLNKTNPGRWKNLNLKISSVSNDIFMISWDEKVHRFLTFSTHNLYE